MIDIEAEQAAIEQLMQAIEAAENRKDLSALLEAMLEDAVLQLCGAPRSRGTMR